LTAAAALLLVHIAAGGFTMGRTKLTSDDKTNMRPHALLDDRPARTVWVDAFDIDPREVTNERYAQFARATSRPLPYHWRNGTYPEGAAELPVFNVNWRDAADFCAWDGKRLPTEAEWERAARGGVEGAEFPNGPSINAKLARFNVETGPVAVGSFAANAFGLFDMAGNVSEWCADWFEREYYKKGEDRNPKGPAEGLYKVIRGGAWSDSAPRLTVYFRNWVRPEQRSPNIGFRCVKSASPQGGAR
jgi:iron(II)-dependent oxidoreductase